MTTKLTKTGSKSSAARGPGSWRPVFGVVMMVRWLVAVIVASVAFLAGPGLVSAGLGSPVLQATPAITTVASPTVTVGSPVNDTATVTGRVNPIPGATVTFNLFAAGDTTCATAPIFTSTVTINADGTATSGSFTPTTAGTYQWIATYNGDANNTPVSGVCGDYQEAVTVTPASSFPPVTPVPAPSPAVLGTPAITTVASPSVALTGSVYDTATVTGRVDPVPGATITFNLYGVGDVTCTGTPVFTSTVAVNADGTATSASFAPAASGDYRWIATYNGDANNNSVSGVCGEAGEGVSVFGPPPPTPTTRVLPATGTGLNDEMVIGGGLLVVGGILLWASSRRRRALAGR